MAGRYNGVQAKLLEMNPLAYFIPCTTHSLNLVGVNAAESTLKVQDIFAFVQHLYTFFAASTHRWNELKSVLSSDSKRRVVEKLSDTWWSARADAVYVLNDEYLHKNHFTVLNYQR